MRSIITSLLIITYFGGFSQNLEKVIANTDLEALRKLHDEFKAKSEEESARADAYLKANNLPRIEVFEDGSMIELVGIKENGEFIYFETDNKQSTETISTDKLWPTALNGYGITGTAIKAAVWDGGKARDTHREFGSRLTQIDGASTISNHATHVSGTIGASGVRADAKGMAPDIEINAYDWNLNTTEMSAAAGNGILVSNHSYGNITGWRRSGNNWYWYGDTAISQTEDYKFGFYGNAAQNFDQVAFAAPYFLIVKSAGNDRNDGPSNNISQHFINPPGPTGWTAISGKVRNNDNNYGSVSSYSMAKNILVVGAVEGITGGYLSPAQINMTNFSCWGPTDDGRIRPDVVAKGRGVVSSWGSGNSAYQSSQGTSMAAPAVTGSAALLQEHYAAVNGSGNYMRSASLRGLIIHTADEAGTFDGPNYVHGWGLMNTKKGADLISDTNAYIIEDKLIEGRSKEWKVVVDQTQDVRLTLCWTDPASNALNPSLNPSTLMLINDLDLRLEHSVSGQTYQPYILDPANPADPASNGDNFRDNVEHILVENIPAGVYYIKLNHKGASLVNGEQNYSLIAEGVGILPEVAFNVNDDEICLGESASVFGITSSDVTQYHWKSPNPNLSFTSPNSQNSTVNFTAPGSYEITLVAYNNRGKDSSTISSAVIVASNPNVQIDSTNIYCIPDVNVQSVGANMPGGTWNGGSWMPFTDTVLFVPSSVGIGDYQLVYSARNDDGCLGKDTAIIEIRESPEASLDSLLSYCNTLPDFALSGGQPFGGSYFVNGVADSLVRPNALGAGIHRVTYTISDTNNCEGSAERLFEIRNCLGLIENSAKTYTVFPNPANNEIVIQANSAIGKIGIYDINSKLLAEYETSKSFFRIPSFKFESGIYFIDNYQGQKTKIIIQH